MAYAKCPECGETNFEEGYSGTRTFACSFRSDGARRVGRCTSVGARRRSAAASEPSADAARYRLALLDAAEVVDALAEDMGREHTHDVYARRCQELGAQIRAFAGHTNTRSRSFFDINSEVERRVSRMRDFVRRSAPW